MRKAKKELRDEKADLKSTIRLTPDAKLTGTEKRRLTAAFRKAQQNGRVPRTAQQTIPYQEMCRDGICIVNGHYFSKQIEFYDINYQLAQNEDKNQIFENYCDFLNYFDSSIHVQFSFLNQRADMEEYQRSIHIQAQADAFNEIREEYSDMLEGQLAKGNNGLTKSKYITFGVEAESLKAAKPRLERIEADVLANFKVLGVRARSLNGYERLVILHRMFHPMDNQKLRFAWDAIWQTGLSSKDFIAPDSFTFQSSRMFKIGQTCGAMSFLQITAPELTDRLLADLLDLESGQIITMHIQSIDQSTAIKNIKRKITDLDAMKIQEQKKAVRAGYDMDSIPSDLTTFGTEAKTLLEDLQSRNERMFLVTVLVMNLAENKQKLENNVFQASSVAQKYNCALRRLEWQQEPGLMSSLPLGLNQINIQRGLTTSSTAIFVPFTTQELFMNGEALYYGLNALSNNLIMADRKKLKNPNGLILGTPGSGKSFSAKREITNAFLITQDDISIIDPEDEYSALVQRLGGQVIDISPTSDQYINPMDITLNYSEDDSPLSLKSDFILSLMELIVGGKSGLEPVEKTIIDRCVHLVYREYLQDPRPEKMPVLGDLHALLCQQTEPEAQRLATALEIYVSGSLNVFNHRTNVEIRSRIVCYVIKKLGKQLKKLGMQIVQDQIWGRVSENRESHKSTRLYVDELHLLLREEQTAAYTVEIWKRFRKWGGIPTGITQNVNDLLSSREIQNIFENSDFIYMLNQAGGDRRSQDFKRAKCTSERPKSFVDDTAEQLHVNPSTVRRELQTAENLTDEAREILQSANIDPPKGDALALSRLAPDQQKDAAAQLASGTVRSVKEYLKGKESAQEEYAACPPVAVRTEPEAAYEATPIPEPPVNVERKEYPTLDDSIRDLKDMDKEFVTTPDVFLDEFSAFLQRFQKDLLWYTEPQYQAVFAAFSPEQYQYLQEALNAVKIDADQFSESVKGVMRHEQ